MVACMPRIEMEFIPSDVLQTMERLHGAGCKVWLVGGVLRDFLLGREPKDWDLATDATPQLILDLFPRVVPIGIRHGTVQVRTSLRGIEVTSTTVLQREGEGILADLGRRDFTINAIAVSYPSGEILDPHEGRKDLQKSMLRAVVDPVERFREDPLRTLRAGRFVSTYGFKIERSTFTALRGESHKLVDVACERIRDEMIKLLLGEHVFEAFECMRRGGVLEFVLPELLEGCRKRQEPHHLFDIYMHTINTVQNTPATPEIRLAALLNGIAKPRVRVRISKGVYKFPEETNVSALMAEAIMKRWCMPKRITAYVRSLVENHLPRNIGEWTGEDIRRFISRSGQKAVNDLLSLAEADRLSLSDRESSLEELKVFQERCRKELVNDIPFAIKDLAVSGDDVMRLLRINPGPEVGKVLMRVYEAVLMEPRLNKHEFLMDFLRQEYHIDT